MPERETVEFTREELYDLVWSRPMTTLAREFCVTDVSLGKWCRGLGLPLPGPGYWRKKEVGKEGPRPPLPPMEGVHTLTLRRYAPGEEPDPDTPRPPRVVPDYEVFEKDPANAIVVPVSLEEPHKLVAQSMRVLGQGEVDKDYGWKRPRYTERRGCLDVNVSQEQLDRAMRLMDAILKGLELRGLPARLDRDRGRHGGTVATVDGEEIHFAIYERLKRVPVDPKEDRYRKVKWQPRGILMIRVYGGRTGTDLNMEAKRGRQLELRLNEFIVWLHQIAESRKQHRVYLERREQERDLERQREEDVRIRQAEVRRREEADASELARFEAMAAQWRRAQQIREYVDAIYHAHQSHGGIEQGSDLARHLDWALNHADRIDPLVRTEG